MASPLRVLALAAALAHVAAASLPKHTCKHDEIVASHRRDRHGQLLHGTPTFYGEHRGRLLQTTTWEPMRLAMIEVGGGIGADPSVSGNGALVAWWRDIIADARRQFGLMYSVVPVVGGLKAQRLCVQWDTTFTPAVCSSYDSLDSSTSYGGSQGDPDITMGPEYLAEDIIVQPDATGTKVWYSLAAGNGFPDADTVIFVTAISTGYCGANTLAYAWAVQTDQYDRPIFGRINLCPGGMRYFYNTGDAAGALNTILHELTHTFVMSSELFPLFRSKDTDRSPLTPRHPKFPWFPSSQYLKPFYCDAGNGDGLQRVQSFFAANTTVRYFNERGMNCSGPENNATASVPYGNCVARVVTPAVAAATQAYFDCGVLPGAELENQDTSPCQPYGSHWEQRVLSGEALAPYILGVHQAYSAITLAIADDSGWYMANFSMAAPMRGRGAEYGHKQGCDYATKTCLQVTAAGGAGNGAPATSLTPGQFPSGPAASGTVCRADLLGPGRVTITNWTSEYGVTLPPHFQYLGDATSGGSLDSADFCPYVEPLPYDCTSDRGVPAVNQQGQTPGADALCMSTTLVDANPVTTPSTQPVGCYSSACQPDGSLLVTVANAPSMGGASSGSQSATCQYNGQTVSFTLGGYSGAITCPNVTAICGPNILDIDPLRDAAKLQAVRAAQASTPPWAANAASPTPMPSLIPYPMPVKGTTLSPGAIIGIVIAGAVVLMAISAAIMMAMPKNNKGWCGRPRHPQPAVAPAQPSAPGATSQPGVALVCAPQPVAYAVPAQPVAYAVAAQPTFYTVAAQPAGYTFAAHAPPGVTVAVPVNQMPVYPGTGAPMTGMPITGVPAQPPPRYS